METRIRIPEMQLQKLVTSFKFPDMKAHGAWVVNYAAGKASYTGKVVQTTRVDNQIMQLKITRQTIEYPILMSRVVDAWMRGDVETFDREVANCMASSETPQRTTFCATPGVDGMRLHRGLRKRVAGRLMDEASSSQVSYPTSVNVTQPMETVIQIPELELLKSMTSFEFPDMETPGAWVLDHTTGLASYTGKVVETIRVNGQITRMTITRRTIEYPVPMLEVAYEWAKGRMEDIRRRWGFTGGSSETPHKTTYFDTPRVDGTSLCSGTRKRVAGEWMDGASSSRVRLGSSYPSLDLEASSNYALLSPIRDPEPPLREDPIPCAFCGYPTCRACHGWTEEDATEETIEDMLSKI